MAASLVSGKDVAADIVCRTQGEGFGVSAPARGVELHCTDDQADVDDARPESDIPLGGDPITAGLDRVQRCLQMESKTGFRFNSLC